MIENNCVVYLHERKDKPGHIFYCGSGKPRRPYSRQRNPYWKNIVSKNDYNIHIVAKDLTEEEARCLEGFIGHEFWSIGMCEAVFILPIDGNKLHVSKTGEDHHCHNLKWMTLPDTVDILRVNLSDVDTYLRLGWELGLKSLSGENNPNYGAVGATTGSKWLNNGIVSKLILDTDLDFYYDQGWVDGRKLPEATVTDNIFHQKGDNHPQKNFRWMNKDGLYDLIPPDETDFYLINGWKFGHRNSGSTFINNGKISKSVLQSDLEKFLDSGWILGRLKSEQPKKVWINNKEVCKIVPEVELDNFRNQGWELGRLYKRK